MLLAISASLIVVLVLLWDVGWPLASERIPGWWPGRQKVEEVDGYDPGRERRAEQRARMLLRSCVNEEEWAMYRDLGFIRVWGGLAEGPLRDRDGGGALYAYLISPHKPIVAYLPQTRRLLSEYCVTFPDETRPYGS